MSDSNPLAERLVAAALEAERETGHREETLAEARRHVLVRLGRAVLGLMVIAIGIVLLPLPGPGWVVVAVGFGLLPFAWAQRVVRGIRRRIPGVPEDGAIPLSTWLVGGGLLVAVTVGSLLWADDAMEWIRRVWTDWNS